MTSAPFRINGQKLAEIRFRAGLNQSALAARLGVHRNYVSRIESGEFNPSPARMLEIATSLGVDIDAISDRTAA